jgi:hypothetical protein
VARRDQVALAGALTLLALSLHAQSQAPASGADPRVALRPGFRDAGQAVLNLELVATLPKPAGFFDPKTPAGPPVPPERPAGRGGEPETAGSPGSPEQPAPGGGPGPAPQAQGGTAPQAPGAGGGLAFANTDLAFSADRMFVGSYHGFNVYVIENARRPQLVSSVVCPGGQGDLSVYGTLLFMSVEQTRARVDCGTGGVPEPVSKERFRGVRIFDISDIRKPRQIAAVQTCRGSHTHTLIVDPRDSANVYIYNSGTGVVRSSDELAGCSGKDPKEDPETSAYSIDVIQVPLAAPATARIVSRPRIFADLTTGALSGLSQGVKEGPGVQASGATDRCHDITAFPALGLAAGACRGNGILLDISNPANPVRLDAVADKNFAFWHSATFNNDGSKVIFTDEWGGGTRPRCRATDSPTWGADAVFEIVDRKLKFAGYYKLPAPQTDQENCVAHNGSIIPVPGRDIMVQGWYQGGISVFDFTESGRPVEIAFFDRGPIDGSQLIGGGYWSAYWNNGYIFASEIARGIDVFRLTPSAFLSRDEIDAAALVRVEELNVQQQPQMSWPASVVVARAYLDQLGRANTLAPARINELRTLVESVDRLRSRRDRGAAGALEQAERTASQLEAEAASASAADARRLRGLAQTLRARAASVR